MHHACVARFRLEQASSARARSTWQRLGASATERLARCGPHGRDAAARARRAPQAPEKPAARVRHTACCCVCKLQEGGPGPTGDRRIRAACPLSASLRHSSSRRQPARAASTPSTPRSNRRRALSHRAPQAPSTSQSSRTARSPGHAWGSAPSRCSKRATTSTAPTRYSKLCDGRLAHTAATVLCT
jgi:hypothetical protein